MAGPIRWGGRSFATPQALVNWMNKRGAGTTVPTFKAAHPGLFPTAGYPPGSLTPAQRNPGDIDNPANEGWSSSDDPYTTHPFDITIPGAPGHAGWDLTQDPTYLSRAAGIHAARNTRLTQALLNLGYLPAGASPEFSPGQEAIERANLAGTTLRSQVNAQLARSGFAGSGQVGYQQERGINDFLAYLAAQNEAEAGDVYGMGQALVNQQITQDPEALRAVAPTPTRTAHWNGDLRVYVDAQGNHYDYTGARVA